MVEQRSEPQWRSVTKGRSCGSCYACCVWLGINELKKWTGQTCKHLDGRDPAKRCSIYDKRPSACSEYKCMWLQGYGPDELQPNRSGILLTGYQSEKTPDSLAVTALVFDEAKAKDWTDSVMREVVTLNDAIELRFVNWHTKRALYFVNGYIYQCRLLPPDGFESLTFEAREPPIGKYRLERGTDT